MSYLRDKVRFLLDANLPQDLAEKIARELEFDCYRVSGTLSDQEILRKAKVENRVLLTLDTDFSNILRYPPDEYSGIVVFRVKNQSYTNVTQAVLHFLDSHKNKINLLKGKTIVVRKNLCRIY